MIRLTFVLCALALASSGCSKCNPPPPETQPSASAVVSAGPPPVLGSAPKTQLGAGEVPTSEDYEVEAAERVNPGNLEPALAEVEREVNADDAQQ